MKKFLKQALVMASIAITLQTNGQDIHFSQMFETPLLRNPALAGLFAGDIRFQTVYRNQWNSITNAYKTGSLNGEVKVPIGQQYDYLTIGGQLLYDKSGTVALTATHVLPSINYHKSLSNVKNSYLSLGVMGGWVQRSFDQSKVTTNSQFDGTNYNEALNNGETFAKSSYSYLDGSIGLSYNTQLGENSANNMFIGLAYHHINKPKKLSYYTDNSAEMKAKWVGSAGVKLALSDRAFFTVQADYTKQGVYSEIIAGMLLTRYLGLEENPKYKIHVGSYLRWNDAIIPVIKLESNPIAIAVSYDANISQLKKATTGRGGFEVSLTYQKFFDRFLSSKDAVRCPSF